MKLTDFLVQNSSGQNVSLKDYQNKVVLVVNVASQCLFTYQYSELEALFKKYKDSGFEILAFPCNQFGNQEPGTDEQIQSFCSLKYDVSFPVMKKTEVNGPNTNPLYSWLKESAPGLLGTQTIKWNFTKFLINKKGDVVKRFSPQDSVDKIEKEILAELKR